MHIECLLLGLIEDHTYLSVGQAPVACPAFSVTYWERRQLVGSFPFAWDSRVTEILAYIKYTFVRI